VFAQNPIAGPDADADDIRQMHSLADALDERIALAQLSNVTHLRSDFAKLATSTIEPKSLDAILMSQILHDFANAGEAAAIALLTSLRTLLKPSGALIVIDHAGESGLDNLRLHRMPVEQAKRVAEAAGYTLRAESSLLANPRDKHRRPVFDPMLARNTDRFLLRFQP
jgi:predicted methyltransferase